MKILILGAAGFIGGHLYEKLTSLGHEVVGIDNFFHPTKRTNPNILKYDIRDSLDEFIKNTDIVFNLAAQIHVDYGNENPKETFDINVNGLINILETCRKYDKKLVFASSSEIYGTAKVEKINEIHQLDPQSIYAVSKLAGDKLCQAYKEVYGMKINIIRNFNTFGEWQNDDSYGGVIAKFTKAALKGQPLIVYGSGLQERDYMYINDALEGYIGSLDLDWNQPINFGTGKTISIIKLAEMIIELTRSTSLIQHVAPRPNEVNRLCADITRAKILGFSPKTDFKRDLIKYINWYQNEL